MAALQGKVAVVTGGSRGLGLLLARELGRRGCRVAICGRSQQSLDWAKGRLEQDGLRVLARQCDVAVREQVEGFLEGVKSDLGPMDILVNNAGIMEVGPLEHMRLEDFEAAMDVMFWGMVYATLAVYPDMVRRRAGNIVNITSIGGKVSVPHLLPYSAAKFAAVGFSEGLTAELAQYGVKVTTVAPGLMRTGSYLNVFVRARQAQELTWFGLGASLPLVSMDGERAAQQIVRAMLRGQREAVLSLPAKALAAVHGLAPGLVVTAMGWVNRLLPAAGGRGSERARGGDVQAAQQSNLLDMATTLSREAARRFQPPGSA
ncbi:MAG TPA: SDR family oxidoreductase [Chloroflexota bacterium]|nr:SDR family oxidoreductase [Chloroflexota bacterium]